MKDDITGGNSDKISIIFKDPSELAQLRTKQTRNMSMQSLKFSSKMTRLESEANLSQSQKFSPTRFRESSLARKATSVKKLSPVKNASTVFDETSKIEEEKE